MKKLHLRFAFTLLLLCISAISSKAGQMGWNVNYDYSGLQIVLIKPSGPPQYYPLSQAGSISITMPAGSSLSVTGNVQANYSWRMSSPPFVITPPPEELHLKELGGISMDIEGFSTGSVSCSIPNSTSQMYSDPEGGLTNQWTTVFEPHPGGESNFHIEQDYSAGQTFSISRNFTASLSAPYYTRVTLGVSYTTDIHATPYNFRIAHELIPYTQQWGRFGDVGIGELIIPYVWNSTSGSYNDLDPYIHLYEVVIVSGHGTQSGDYFYASYPPFYGQLPAAVAVQGWPFENPLIGMDHPDDPTQWRVGSRGMIQDRHSRGGAISTPPHFSGVFTVTSNQNWMYNDSLLNRNIRVPSPTGVSGLNVITRTCFKLPEAGPCGANCTVWRFQTTKHNFTAWQDSYCDPSDPAPSGFNTAFRDSLAGNYY